jgi:hypothetical protein
MLIFVIIFNLCLSIVNIYILLKIIEFTKNLKNATRVLTNVQYHVYGVLNPAPQWVMIGQKGTHNLRLHLQVLTHQLNIINKLLTLTSWLYKKI